MNQSLVAARCSRRSHRATERGQGNSGDEALSVGVLGIAQNLVARTLPHESTAMPAPRLMHQLFSVGSQAQTFQKIVGAIGLEPTLVTRGETAVTEGNWYRVRP